MSEIAVASRYAKSLIDLSEEQSLLETIYSDMVFFTKTLKENVQLNAVLSNPIVSHLKKRNILTEIFAAKVNKLTTEFFKLLINKGRGEVIYGTAQQFISLYNIKNNIIKAKVVSATELSEANKQTLLEEIKTAVGKQIVLETKVDPALIGGFVLIVGDRQLDTSVQTSLRKIKKNFATAAVK
jgi:F-type H+-transporting ATPase subunit delta